MCDIEKEIIENLTDTERKNIGDILKALKDEDKKSIINCINNCTSPVTIEVEDKNIQEKIKTIFNAFTLFPISETQILILGQDPYPNAERAHGLAFSFGDNKIPADDSLLNIFNAIQKYNSYNEKPIEEWNTNLEYWAKTNKVLLLNTALTYCKEIKKDDRMDAWRPFVKQIIINLLNKNEENNKLVIFLWGGSARKLFNETIFDKKMKQYPNKINRNILVLSTSHPSNNYDAVYKGFCYEAPNHFKACDDFLCENIWKNFPDNNKKQ